MNILNFIIVCVVLGLLLWAINTLIPMEPKIKHVMNVGVAILLVLWLIFAVFGSNLGEIGTLRIGR